MYGQTTPQTAVLAATGVSVLYWSVAAGVLFMAGLTLVTIASVIRHKARNRSDDE